MIAILAVGGLVMTICLAFQAFAAAYAVRYFAQTAKQPLGRFPRLAAFRLFTILMLVLMAGNIVQVGIWALLYQSLGAFDGFQTALYFSGVTFTSLGYGDVLLTGPMRLLGPLQAANGLMMFGITTAVFIAAVQFATQKWLAAQREKAETDGQL